MSWYGEPGRHAQAARGIKSKVAPLNDRSWLFAEDRMEDLIRWVSKRTELARFEEWSLRDRERFAHGMEDVIFYLKRSRKRPKGFDESIEYAEGVIGSWETEPVIGLEAARQDLHTMMQGYASEA